MAKAASTDTSLGSMNTIAAIAAEDIGAVSAIPMSTATTIPMTNGTAFVPALTNHWIAYVTYIAGKRKLNAKINPKVTANSGTIKISTGVFFLNTTSINKATPMTVK